MKKFIEVYDKVIPKSLSDVVEEKILKSGNFSFNYFDKIYDYHPTYSPNLPKGFGFGNQYIKEGKIINPNLTFYDQILIHSSKQLGFKLDIITLARIWLLVPEKDNYISFPHVDSYNPHLVCLYYINNTDGDTVFFKDDKKTIFKRVSPKKGRVVIFDGSIYHSSSSPTTNPRAIINYNFTINK